MILNHRLRGVWALLLIVAGAISAHGQSKAGSTPSSAEAAVLARLSEIQLAAQELDPDKVFRFVLDNDKGALVQGGRLFLTRQAALQSTAEGFRELQAIDYRFDEQHITLLSPTIALATGAGVSRATTRGGREFSTRFAQSVVLILSDGQWKVFHAHRSFPSMK